jgi:predicted Holliday junction resolvase-like endonuclease
MDDIIAYPVLVLALALAVAVLILYLLNRRLSCVVEEYGADIQELRSRKQSLSTKYGKMTEMFFPLLETYPYDHDNFRFIGNPVDGIQFEEDRVILVEFKMGDSRLSPGQRRIRDMVADNRVDFEEYRIPPEV